MLLVQEPHFENHWSDAIFVVTDNNVLDKDGSLGGEKK